VISLRFPDQSCQSLTGEFLFKLLFTALLLLVPAAMPEQAYAQNPDESLRLLQKQDRRLARVAAPILQANARLCTSTMPLTGLVLHSRDQYRDSAASLFANGQLAVAAVVPSSPAARAGLQAGDGIESIAGIPVATLDRPEENPFRDAALDVLARQPADEPLEFGIRREDRLETRTLVPEPACRILFEILAERDLNARTDGRVLQISYGMADGLSDEGLAVVFAHELAHVVLHHRKRLEAAGVRKGLLGEIGKNQQRNRQVEVEADRLTPHLLANAGLDPNLAVGFWLSDEGDSIDGGLLPNLAYPTRSARADLIEREIAQYLPARTGPTWPGHLLARRDMPF
jgi:hypothetical protein